MTAVRVTIETQATGTEAAGPKVTVDATLTEKHSTAVELTKYPVEEGVSPTDHAREVPERVQLDGIFSNTPVEAKAQQDAYITDDAAVSYGAPGRFGDANASLATMLRMKSARKAMTISGPLRTYTNMVMTQFDFTRDSKMGDAVRFSASFEQVRFVKGESTRLKVVQTKVPEKPYQKKDNGKQSTTGLSETDKAGVKKSWAKQVVDAAKAFFGP
jgi:hypothetical protein